MTDTSRLADVNDGNAGNGRVVLLSIGGRRRRKCLLFAIADMPPPVGPPQNPLRY